MSETPRQGTKVGETDWFQVTGSCQETPTRTQQIDVSGLFSPAQEPDEIGRVAHYRVLKPLGAGGMGMVFLAEDTQLKRQVAIKIVHPDVTAPEAKERILQEARALAAIRDERVVTIHQVGAEGEIIFLAMEFLPGQSLETYLEQHPRPTPGQILYIGQEAALGLAAAHAHHLIHRDIKPANIWLEPRSESSRGMSNTGFPHPEYRVKLLDFGLARKAKESFKLTKPGSIMGTPHYIAPEQAQGAKPDVPSDLYSLGVVLYRLCTGRLPFPQEDLFSLMTALATQQPPQVRDLAPETPAPLAELVMRLLAKNPAERPASAQVVAEVLQTIKQGGTPTFPALPPRAAGRVFPWWKAAVLLLICGGIVTVTVLIMNRDHPESHRTVENTDELATLYGLPADLPSPPEIVQRKPEAQVCHMEVIGRKQYPNVNREASALVKSTRHPGIYWTLNDHLNPARLYALEASGKLRAIVHIDGAENDDWESLTSDGQGNLYIGDTGNNDLKRLQGTIYRIREPDLPEQAPVPGQVTTTVPVEAVFHYTFPGRPFDCEAIFFCQGELYLINLVRDRLRFKPPHVLFRLPLQQPGQAVPLVPVCRLPNYIGEVRDASLSADGRSLALCNARQIILYTLTPESPLAGLAHQVPRLFTYPNSISRRFEGCSWDGDTLILIAEVTTEIYRATFPPPP